MKRKVEIGEIVLIVLFILACIVVTYLIAAGELYEWPWYDAVDPLWQGG